MSNNSEPLPGASLEPVFTPDANESPDAFAAFMVYFRLPGKRRLTAVAQATGAGMRSVHRWAHDFNWVARVQRHQASNLNPLAKADIAQARNENMAWSERAIAIREREWEIADDLFDALQRRLRDSDPDVAALAALARTFTLASKIGRLATGLAPRAQDEINATDPLDKEFNAALQTAYGAKPIQQPTNLDHEPSAPTMAGFGTK